MLKIITITQSKNPLSIGLLLLISFEFNMCCVKGALDSSDITWRPYW